MVNLIVDQIVQGLKLDLSFVDKITGIVKPIQASIGGVVKSFPVALNTLSKIFRSLFIRDT